MKDALRSHWPEYFMEGALLALFMISACAFGVLLEHPDLPLRGAIPNDFLRRMLAGAAMGLTAIALIYSPWGRQSGAHMNPAVTLTFFWLGKVRGWDAFFYIAAQVCGGVAGVVLAHRIWGALIEHPSVNYVVTVPGPSGVVAAVIGEATIAFVQMSVVLAAISSPRLMRYTGVIAGVLVATYITLEAPYSGMSMNPARTLGSAIPANVFSAIWIYFLVPPLAMLAAAKTRKLISQRSHCAKVVHAADKRCIFCGYGMLPASEAKPQNEAVIRRESCTEFTKEQSSRS